jgi:hypothetical protein
MAGRPTSSENCLKTDADEPPTTRGSAVRLLGHHGPQAIDHMAGAAEVVRERLVIDLRGC